MGNCLGFLDAVTEPSQQPHSSSSPPHRPPAAHHQQPPAKKQKKDKNVKIWDIMRPQLIFIINQMSKNER